MKTLVASENSYIFYYYFLFFIIYLAIQVDSAIDSPV